MALQRVLDAVERAGNRLPHPAALFAGLALAVVLLSWLSALLGLSATHPISGEAVAAVNLFSGEGLRRTLTQAVSNFTGFAPVGTVLVAVLGMGIAEHSGLIASCLRATILRAPRRLLTFSVVVAGVLSSIAADAGYVVLIPLAGVIFASVGRSPVLGIVAAFAGVSAGFSANLVITPLDALLAGLSTEAARLTLPGYSVNAAGNWYFLVVSTFLIGAVGTWVTERIVAPRFAAGVGFEPDADPQADLSAAERRGLKGAAAVSLILAALLLLGLLPADGILRDPASGSILRSPAVSGIVVIIAAWAAVTGLVYGRLSGRYQRLTDGIAGMEQHIGALAGYLVLMFFAAQFVSFFAWSNLGAIFAIRGAAVLETLSLPAPLLLVGLVLLAALVNLVLGSASAKWALLAPIFVPMLALTGISPEATQMAYRIGDSSTNIITPLMPYFAVVLAFARQYQAELGLGSLIAAMLPYSAALLLAWSALLAIWAALGIPLGPGAPVMLPG